ncbi:MAG: DNA topoisomerase 4 subunit A [Bifidobacteriaceae bacterium]|jgi:DNA gyrase subunit A|nr:DNA topoisomerase 4 subunit A [Bifidobacteriaceae bacterium]
MADNEKILDIDINQEMSDSFLEYAYSVIYSRALPDARDGLKPVQRRIIYQMSQMGLSPDKPFVKSARVIGDVMGKLHPHGDVAIYDAMVRLAQDFSLNVPLVTGHGNFGSLHDSPAAPRYTEAKLSKYSLLMCQSIDEDTVDWLPNYDNKLNEPEVLPALFPNLLVNGSSGIAVGMATNIPSHNLTEVLQASIYLINNPACSIKDLQKYIKGPDFPGGGVLVDRKILNEIYASGRGLLKVRAKPNIEINGRIKSIIFTQLPYLVDPEKVISRIKDGINSGKIQGISSVGDFTDRKRGIRLQIDIKSGFDDRNVLAQLYKFTPLEETFGVNMVALVNGHPQILNLKQILAVWIKHRINVLRRRSLNRLKIAQDRLHLVKGLLLAIDSIDEVIKIIRNSETQNQALNELKTNFSLDDIQANYILDLRLRRLTKFSHLELSGELSDLQTKISELSKILDSQKVFQELLISEINQVLQNNIIPRKTIFSKKDDALLSVTESDIVKIDAKNIRKPILPEGKEVFVIHTARGNIATLPGSLVDKSQINNIKHINAELKKDAITQILHSFTNNKLLVLLSNGKMTNLSVSSLPTISKIADLDTIDLSYKLDIILELPLDIKPLLLYLANDDSDRVITAASVRGTIIRIKSFKIPEAQSFLVVNLSEGDFLVSATTSSDSSTLVFITSRAQLLLFPANKVRPQGKGSSGMRGIALKGDDTVIAFTSVDNLYSAHILTIAGTTTTLSGTETGFAKVNPLSIYPAKGRATGGVRCQRFLKNQTALIFAQISQNLPTAFTSRGKKVNLPAVTDKRDSSGEQLDYPVKYVI